jgi:hypothetical protein
VSSSVLAGTCSPFPCDAIVLSIVYDNQFGFSVVFVEGDELPIALAILHTYVHTEQVLIHDTACLSAHGPIRANYDDMERA